MLATFAAGCFWGVEAGFAALPGVTKTTVGYTGGNTVNPNYEQVCNGRTGHAESVQVEYDPNIITYEELLEYFWSAHNPTSLNRQGPDIGTQYRSVIFYHDKDQHQAAEKSKTELENVKRFSYKIVTEISPATTFYPAEDYHQKYWLKHPEYSCHPPKR